MTDYCLNGYLGFDNFGDDWLVDTIVNDIKRFDTTARFYVLSGSGKCHRNDVIIINRKNIPVVRRCLRHSVALINTGGIYQDESSKRSLVWYGFIMSLAEMAGIPVIDYSVSIGPLLHKTLQRKTLRMLSRHHCMLRDEYSYTSLMKMAEALHVDFNPLTIQVGEDICFHGPLPKPYSNREGILIVPHLNKEKKAAYNHLKNIYQQFKNKIAVPVKIGFTMPKENQMFWKSVPHYGSWQTVVHNKAALFHAISGSKLVITDRYHVLVAALRYGIPTIAVSNNPKVAALVDTYNLSSLDNFDDCTGKGLERIKEMYYTSSTALINEPKRYDILLKKILTKPAENQS